MISCIGLIQMTYAQPNSAQRDYRYFKSGYGSYHPGTLFEAIEYGPTSVKVIPYKSQNGSRVYMPNSIEIPLSTWTSKTQRATEKKDGQSTMISAKTGGGYYSITPYPICAPQSPRLEADTNAILISAQTRLTPPPSAPPPATPAKKDETPLEKKERITKELNEDLNWYRRNMSTLYAGSSESRHTSTVINLLSAMKKAENFQGTHGKTRANRLLHYLTLYGEFRSYQVDDQHRTLAHLYWCTESMMNRLRYPPKVSARKERIQSIRSVYDPTGSVSKFLNNGLGCVGMAGREWAAWHPGPSTLDDMLTQRGARQDIYLQSDLVDFIAAYEAGLIVQDTSKPNPRITHYVSPSALPKSEKTGNRIYPYYWKNSDKVSVFKGTEAFPKIRRLDNGGQPNLLNTSTFVEAKRAELSQAKANLDAYNKGKLKLNQKQLNQLRGRIASISSYLSQNPLDQSQILPDHFEGARESW